MKKRIIIAALAVALGGVGVNVYAQTSSTSGDNTLSPSLTLTGSCTVAVTNTAVNSPSFGTASIVSATIGSVTVC